MDSSTIAILAIAGLFAVLLILTRIFLLMPAAKALTLLGRGAILLDVRTIEEFRSGSVKGAVNIPHQEVGARIASIVPDKSTPVLVYCLSGGRSGVAKGVLRRLGYSEAHNLGSLARAKRIVESSCSPES